MKIPIRLKLFFSYVGIIFASLTTLGWTASYLLNQQFNSFVRNFDVLHMGPRPSEAPGATLFINTLESSLAYTTLAAGLLAIVLSALLSVLFTRPIKDVIHATKAIAKGNYKKRVTVASNDELGELGTALNTMAESLEENQRLQQDLVTTMIHELATPLTNISGYLEAMNDGVIRGQKRDETLILMQEEAARLNNMVMEVRDLAQLQHPNFAIHPRPLNLHNLVDKVITQMEPQLKEKELKIVYKSSAETEVLPLDHDRMIQVLQNLLNNAIKFSPKEGVITIRLTKQKSALKLSIADQGPGIPKEDLPHIFDRFYRADRSRSRKTGGLGIGLTLVKEILEAHGGSIVAKDQDKNGSLFICHLPQYK